jgi:uncharacterized membrane protein
MKDPLVKGHPLHAMLSDLPVGTTVAGVAFDMLGAITRAPGWRFAARAALGTALASGAAAAAAGLWDYQAVPSEHPARRIGALHGILNACALLLLLLSLLARRQRAAIHAPDEAAARAWALAALGVLAVSGWLGGDLVFKLGWRVIPAEHAEQLEAELRQDGQVDRIERAHATVQQYEQAHALLP